MASKKKAAKKKAAPRKKAPKKVAKKNGGDGGPKKTEMSINKSSDKNKKPLKEWRDEFYDDTKTLSSLIRNLGLAGIGLIWIFKNTDLSHNILPKELKLPLIFIIAGLIADLVQYLWRGLSIYVVYKHQYNQHQKKILSDKDIEDVEMPGFISIVTYIFFFAKIFLIGIAYFYIYQFLISKI